MKATILSCGVLFALAILVFFFTAGIGRADNLSNFLYLEGRVAPFPAEYVPALEPGLATTVLLTVPDPATGDLVTHEVICLRLPRNVTFPSIDCERFKVGQRLIVEAWIDSGIEDGKYSSRIIARKIRRVVRQ